MSPGRCAKTGISKRVLRCGACFLLGRLENICLYKSFLDHTVIRFMINTRRRIFLLAFLVEPAGAAFKEAAPTDQKSAPAPQPCFCTGTLRIRLR